MIIHVPEQTVAEETEESPSSLPSTPSLPLLLSVSIPPVSLTQPTKRISIHSLPDTTFQIRRDRETIKTHQEYFSLAAIVHDHKLDDLIMEKIRADSVSRLVYYES